MTQNEMISFLQAQIDDCVVVTYRNGLTDVVRLLTVDDEGFVSMLVFAEHAGDEMAGTRFQMLTESGRGSQEVPASGASQRNRKKCFPQREHRYGEISQAMAPSKEFRIPTPLNTTDLQCGQ